MRISIMQPTYIPWAGNFAMMALSNRYVFLDNVQFDRRSWQVRNRILLSGSEHLLTVPVKKIKQETNINDIMINDDTNWRYKHVTTLQSAYKKAPFAQEALSSIIDIILNKEIKFLSMLNTKIISYYADILGLDIEFSFASKLGVGGNRSQRLLEICNYYNATHYLSPSGSKDYLLKDGNFEMSKITVEFLNFIPKQYPQKGTNSFVSHLSIIDVIANLGIDGGRAYVSGPRSPNE